MESLLYAVRVVSRTVSKKQEDNTKVAVCRLEEGEGDLALAANCHAIVDGWRIM